MSPMLIVVGLKILALLGWSGPPRPLIVLEKIDNFGGGYRLMQIIIEIG